jgi:signal transduction histidine kinase
VRRLFQSFYARLSTLFLVLTLALGAGFIAIAFSAAAHLFDEVEQLLNREYAGSIAGELAPLVSAGFDEKRVSGAIHYMMVLNPRVEFYLLDAAGRILSYFASPAERLALDSIDPAPLRSFIASGGSRPILGQDPRGAGRRKPFSAAPLRMGGQDGYVYVILEGQGFDRSLAAIRESYYMRAGMAAVLVTLLATLAAGFALFFLLTRRLSVLGQAVKAFQAGDLGRRARVRGSDELGVLGRTFNDMAASLQAGMEKLTQSERMRTELIANISHDLRSPIASIRGSLETIVLKEGELSPEQRRQFVQTSLRNTESLQKLVDELFDLVKLETRQVEPRRESFPLAELAQDVVLKLKPQADRASVLLTADLPPDLPPVRADIGMIERVLSNLIENALRFTPEGGSVRVALSVGDGSVAVCVSDTGSGISPEDLPHIFERFYRADKSRDRSSAGAGLGLAIAKQIVELHGSPLSVESSPGRGARFHFSLPASP